MGRRVLAATAAATLVIFSGTGAFAQAGAILDFLGFNGNLGGLGSLDGSFWQGSWGVAGRTPVITVAGSNVSYRGSNQQPFAVSSVSIDGARITFQVGAAQVALVKRGENNAEMVSTMAGHSSRPIILCRSDARRCP